MAKHPKLENLDKLFSKGEDFALTDAQYERKTGVMLPKDKNYLLNKSALAKKAKQAGYSMEVTERRVDFKKM